MFRTIDKNSSNIRFSEIYLVKISYDKQNSPQKWTKIHCNFKDWFLYNHVFIYSPYLFHIIHVFIVLPLQLSCYLPTALPEGKQWFVQFPLGCRTFTVTLAITWLRNVIMISKYSKSLIFQRNYEILSDAFLFLCVYFLFKWVYVGLHFHFLFLWKTAFSFFCAFCIFYFQPGLNQVFNLCVIRRRF